MQLAISPGPFAPSPLAGEGWDGGEVRERGENRGSQRSLLQGPPYLLCTQGRIKMPHTGPGQGV
jgi:hypothetical protein